LKCGDNCVRPNGFGGGSAGSGSVTFSARAMNSSSLDHHACGTGS
jgi:hypothetical protein